MDEEQLEKLTQTLELLIAAGYFRAKIQGLDNFDKIVGGIVWCISQCARKVDVDLLYSESATIGQKIALTERIVRVLPELNCPHSLEPHQIQGLDVERICPVVQWLVKEASFVRERLGDETSNFAVYQFGQQGWYLSEDLEVEGQAGVLPMVKRRRRKVYKRVMRMEQKEVGKSDQQGTVETENDKEMEDNDGKLLVVEGGRGPSTMVYLESAEQNAEENAGREMDEKRSADELRKELEELELEERTLDEELSTERTRTDALRTELDELETDLGEYEKAIGEIPKETLEKLRTLLAQRDEIKSSESEFKAQCRSELAELDLQIEKLEAIENGETKDMAKENEDEESEISGEMARAVTMATELRAINAQIVRLQRIAGKKPSQAELAQYQRRFVELCNQMCAKHSETKRQYTLHNTLVTVRQFIRKEMDLLNSIDDQRDLAMREEYRDSLLENLQQIGRGVDDSLDKMMAKKRTLQEQRDQLHDQLQTLLDKQRFYTRAVVEFQQACQRNEQLMAAIDTEGKEQKLPP